MTRIEGIGVGTGFGTGPAFWLDRDTSSVEEMGEKIEEVVESTDPDRERARFTAARDAALAELQAEQVQTAAAIGATGEDVLATHESFLTDPALEERVDAEIEAGAPAARAIATALQDWIDVFEEQGGRTAARADDLRDLRGRLLRALSSDTARSITDAPAGAIVLATQLSPSDAALLDPDSVAGVAAVRGSPDGHAAILARAAGVPMVVDAGPDLHQFQTGRTVAVDAPRGLVHDYPGGSVDGATTGDVSSRARDAAPASPVRTASGRVVRVGANVGSGDEAARAAHAGADGIVLFRSEVLAYQHDGIPDVDTQSGAYRDALDAFPDGQVAIRTFDFGGDKPRPPARGDGQGDAPPQGPPVDRDVRQQRDGDVRGIERSLLAESKEFDAQLRALCRASEAGAGSLLVLLPHVTDVEQVQDAKARLETVATEEGVEPPELGAMVETPAAVTLAPDLAGEVSCLSLGTNDLLAGLRGTRRDADTPPDPTTPAFLRSLVRTADAALDADVSLSCCGELARDSAWARRFVALGVDALGVPPRDVAQTSAAVADLDVPALRERVRDAAEASTNSEVRRRLSGSEHG